MSQTPLQSRPPEGSVSASMPPAADGDGADRALEALASLRAELSATTEPSRQARLLADIADLEEQTGDQPSAARDYLGAYNASPMFREPLEGLIRLLERRRSLKNLGKLIDALVRAAVTADERVRGLVMKAWHDADVAGDVGEAKASVTSATETEGASPVEMASAWLLLE